MHTNDVARSMQEFRPGAFLRNVPDSTQDMTSGRHGHAVKNLLESNYELMNRNIRKLEPGMASKDSGALLKGSKKPEK